MFGIKLNWAIGPLKIFLKEELMKISETSSFDQGPKLYQLMKDWMPNLKFKSLMDSNMHTVIGLYLYGE